MFLGFLALLLTAFIGGAISPLLAKFGAREIPPITVTFFRYFVAIMLFLPIFLIQKREKLKRPDSLHLFGNSLFFIANVSLFGIGIQYTTLIMSQIFYACVPLWTAILGYAFFREKITKDHLIGWFIALIGLVIIIVQSLQNQNATTFGTPLGNMLVFVATISWAFYLVFSKKIADVYRPTTIQFYNFLATVIVLSFILPFEHMVRPLVMQNITVVGIGSILGLAVFSSVIFIYLIQFCIKKVGSFTTSLTQYLGPFAAIITAVPFAGEKITPSLVIAGIFILCGIFYATTYRQLRKYKRPVLQ